MATAMVTSRGRVTLPRTVRERLGVEAGGRVDFVETSDGFLVKPMTRDIRSLKGSLAKRLRRVSVPAMNRGLARMGRMK